MVQASGKRKVIGRPASEIDDAMGLAWIRGFKAGSTQLRILQPTDQWWGYKEHWGGSKEIGYFPCSGESDCVGCNDLSEKVRGVTNKFCFNALSEDGKVRVYKVGSKIRDKFKGREQDLGKDLLLRRDVIIIRMGSDFTNTQYDTDWGDEYPLDQPPAPEEMNDLAQVVTDTYYEAERLMRSTPDVEPDHSEGDDEPQAQAPAPQQQAAAPAAPAAGRTRLGGGSGESTGGKRKLGAKSDATPVPAAEPTPDEAQVEAEAAAVAEPEPAATPDSGPSVQDQIDKLAGMETDDIRSTLKSNDPPISFGARAPRMKVIEIATEAIKAGQLVLPPF